ncbi:MAG: phosphotransferase [Bradyrhizobium sp.]|nr:phosphotransferase [Bradyrhizobium sp.]
MTRGHFGMFPIAHRDSAAAALAAAFGSAPIGAVTAMAGGATTASVYRVEVGERRYLLRIEGEPSPLRNPHQYVSMRIATEAGIAPAIRYLDEAARIVVIDFIEQQPLKSFPGGPRALAQALGELFSRVQATPVFPYYVNYGDIVTRLFAHVQRTGLFAAGLLEAHAEHLELIRKTYDAGASKLVSSHNDPTPNNILFDGERLWLIDWESACCNDSLVDAAIVLDQFARSEALEEVLLKAWFGRAPDEALRARLAPARALTHLFYAGVMFSASAAASWAKDDTDLSAPTPEQFRLAIDEGRLKRHAVGTRHILGKMYLASFLSGVAAPKIEAVV